MGREIRRVPPNWQHPMYSDDECRDDPALRGRLHPIFDEVYDDIAAQWLEEANLWAAGKHPDQLDPITLIDASKYKYFWEWTSNPPDRNYYRQQEWTTEEATAYQMYETVSEGTPVTPVFATLQELEDWLVERGECHGTKYERRYSREAAHNFCGRGWAPSMIGYAGALRDGITGMAALDKEKQRAEEENV